MRFWSDAFFRGKESGSAAMLARSAPCCRRIVRRIRPDMGVVSPVRFRSLRERPAGGRRSIHAGCTFGCFCERLSALRVYPCRPQRSCRGSGPDSRNRSVCGVVAIAIVVAVGGRATVTERVAGGGEERAVSRRGKTALPFRLPARIFSAACGRSQKEAEGRERFGIYRYLCPEGRGLLPRPVAEPFGGTAFKFHSECSSKRS